MTKENELLPCPFESKINKTETCWFWTGAVQSKGYGNYKSKLAHRVSYEKYVGKIPEGLTLDHLCRNKLCVNPAHLEPVTQYENNMRGESPTAKNKKKTHCSSGHELSEENIRVVKRVDGMRRHCKICERAHKKQARNKRHAPQSVDVVTVPREEWNAMLALVRLIEECSEVQKVACKSLRFGPEYTNPETGKPNSAELQKECADLSVAMDQTTDCYSDDFLSMREAKRNKIEAWKSKELFGTIPYDLVKKSEG